MSSLLSMFVRNSSHLWSGKDRMNIDDNNNNDKLHISELLIKKKIYGGCWAVISIKHCPELEIIPTIIKVLS